MCDAWGVRAMKRSMWYSIFVCAFSLHVLYLRCVQSQGIVLFGQESLGPPCARRIECQMSSIVAVTQTFIRICTQDFNPTSSLSIDLLSTLSNKISRLIKNPKLAIENVSLFWFSWNIDRSNRRSWPCWVLKKSIDNRLLVEDNGSC